MPDSSFICNVCGSGVGVRGNFCGNCGADARTSPRGLLLPLALSWRGHLARMGWWDEPEARFLPLIDRLTTSGELPPRGGYEPWIMFSNGAWTNWKLAVVLWTDHGGRWQWVPDTALLATRCRILSLSLAGDAVQTLWYRDIRRADRDRYRATAHVHLAADRGGTELHLGMPFEGQRSIEMFGPIDPSDPLASIKSAAPLHEWVRYEVDFHEMVALFLTDICAVAKR
jgi:hypothetical protein